MKTVRWITVWMIVMMGVIAVGIVTAATAMTHVPAVGGQQFDSVDMTLGGKLQHNANKANRDKTGTSDLVKRQGPPKTAEFQPYSEGLYWQTERVGFEFVGILSRVIACICRSKSVHQQDLSIGRSTHPWSRVLRNTHWVWHTVPNHLDASYKESVHVRIIASK